MNVAVWMIAVWVLAGVVLTGCVFHLAGAVLVARFAARKLPPPLQRPPVTLMKPLCGAEPHLLDDLAGFWDEDWPCLRMVCGIKDPADPAVEVVRTLKDRLPHADIRLVVSGSTGAANAKVGNLMTMTAEAADGVLVISDSDMRTGPGYLDAVAGTLAEPGVGLATCLYVGRPESDGWSAMAAMGINHSFLPAALVATALGRKDGCFGATMALTRETLERVGGFEKIADTLADDYHLGRLVRESGLSIALAPQLVETRVTETRFAQLAAHELRWGRTIASVAPFSALASVVTQPALAWGLAPTPLWPLLFLALACRWLAVRGEEHALSLPPSPRWRIVARDLLSLALFVATFCGRSVTWRGRRYRIRRDGTLEARA